MPFRFLTFLSLFRLNGDIETTSKIAVISAHARVSPEDTLGALSQPIS